MRYFKAILSTFILAGMVACSNGGSKETVKNNPPATKTYGIFRGLKPKAVPMKVGKVEAAITTANITARTNHRAIQMLDGRVLLVGGDYNTTNPTMDLFDPKTETFTQSLAHPTYWLENSSTVHAFATVNLPDGKVWIGGCNSRGLQSDYSPSYDIYDGANDTITKFDIDNSLTQLAQGIWPVDQAFYIGNSKVMMFFTTGNTGILDLTTSRITYGMNDKMIEGSVVGSSFVQDGNGDIWQFGGTLVYATSTVPANTTLPYVYKYNTGSETWERKHDLLVPRMSASAVLLPNGKIGIYGGVRMPMNTKLLSVEIYDISTDIFTSSVDLVGERSKAASVYLQTGYTLISGGDSGWGIQDSQLVHKASDNFSGSTGLMTINRSGHTATILNNGLVLIAGGSGSAGMSEVTAEIFDPLAKLYVSYMSEQVVVGNSMQFATKDATGNTVSVNWTVNNTSIATIDNAGLLTTLTDGNLEVTATSVADSTITAVVRIKVLPQ